MNSYGSGIPLGGIPPGRSPSARSPLSINFPSAGPDYSESGFRKNITFLQSPAVRASFVSITIFLLIVFSTNVLFTSATLAAIGIIITLSVLAFIALLLLIIFSF